MTRITDPILRVLQPSKLGIWVASILVNETSKRTVLRKIEKTDGIFMNEFLLLVLVIIYLVISYVPISGAPKATWQSHRHDRSSHGNAKTNAGTRS